ncbi:hypothetical protein MAC_04842 [Metarhizium acridum CQMa 102]|uniref:Uncharacterized protein n=1 Tax=Metarhizium acridum (strain CQMa 102) TaxID=655827 RepID=E9E4P4_METAQ|nr:uncharacterized protein MAC_04842 [Metarhizium acridum CQMa 102]EFY89067.1 hypothetical protein MAC_04842 [Metarhizium acridum CQMa 102]
MTDSVPEHPDLPHPPEDMANVKGIPADAVPNDLPATNGTALETGSAGVPYPIIGGDGPDEGFYIKYPAGAPAKFSTDHGVRAFRTVDVEKFAVEHTNPRWLPGKVQEYCNSIRKKHGECCMKDLKRLNNWTDLYEYYDAHDIYHIGHHNLLDVLRHLVTENEELDKQYPAKFAGIIDSWIYMWLSRNNNKMRLKSWTTADGDITCLFSKVDFDDLYGIKDDHMIALVLALMKKREELVLESRDEGRIVNGAGFASANIYFENPQLSGQPFYPQARCPSASAVKDLRRTTAAATPNCPRAIANSTSQSRRISPVKQQATTSTTTNAVPPNHHNQPHRSVNTENDVGPAVVAQTQASPSPGARKDRPVQHVTTNGKSPLTQAQPSSLKSLGRNHAKQSGTIAPKAAKPVPTQPRGFMMVGVQPASKGGNTVPSRAHPQNGNGKPVGRQIPEKMGQTSPPMSHSGPPTQSPQTRRNQGGLARNACVELPPKPRSDGRRAVSFGDASFVDSTTYGNGSSMLGNGSYRCDSVHAAMFDGAFQTQLSHQLPAAAPGCNPSPAGTTSTHRGGSYTRGGYRHKGRRGPQNYEPHAEYPVQAGRGSFYSQTSHQVDTAQGSYRSNTRHYYNRNPDHENERREQVSRRSVWAQIKERPPGHSQDIKSRLKSAMDRQFGIVEDAFPTFQKNGEAFIVRFKDEASALKSLQSGSLKNGVQGLEVEIRPVHSRKQMKDQYVNRGGPGNQQCQPYHNETHFPMGYGMPSPTCGPHVYYARGLHNLPQANQMTMTHVPHSLHRNFPGIGPYKQGIQAHVFGSSFPQPMMPQQAPPQSSQEYQIPKQEASKAIPRQEEEKRTKSAADRETAKSSDWKAQSKPLSEEALENDDPFEKDGATTPTSQGSKSSQISNRKVRVSLPSVSPPRLAQSKAPKSEKPIKEPGKSPVGQEPPPKLTNSPGNVITQAQPSHTRQVPDDTLYGVPLASGKGSETLATTTTSVTGTRSNFTEEKIRQRQAYSNMIAMPLSPRNIKKAASTESNPGNAIRDKAASSEPLPSDTTCHVPRPAQHIPDAESFSVKSDESKTMSASSSPSNRSPSSNPNKTPDNRNTASPHSRHHSKVSKTPTSPINKNAEANKNQKPTSQEEDVVERGSCLSSRADQDSSKFPGNGRETIRVRKVEKGETASNEGSVQERGTASRKRGWKTRPASRSIGFIDQNQQQESQPRVEVTSATDSATRNEASASTTRTPRITSPASVGGSNNVNLRNASSDRDNGGGSGWQKVRSRRRASKRTNTPGSSDHQG